MSFLLKEILCQNTYNDNSCFDYVFLTMHLRNLYLVFIQKIYIKTCLLEKMPREIFGFSLACASCCSLLFPVQPTLLPLMLIKYCVFIFICYTVFCFFFCLFTLEWGILSPCCMQIWPCFSSRVSHDNPHQFGHSRPGLYHVIPYFIPIILYYKVIVDILGTRYSYRFYVLRSFHFALE